MATRKSAPARRSPPPQHAYQLLVTLLNLQPAVWRRLWVPGGLTLARLDRVIQAAMGWTNSHQHEFEIEGRRYGWPDDEWDAPGEVLVGRRYRVGEVLGTTVPSFVYTYDFGDNWAHEVQVEGILPLEENRNSWPICLDGANACPPEDVGGVGGYMDFLQAMRDPTHEEHLATWRWCGGPFDPTAFSVNDANREIRRIR